MQEDNNPDLIRNIILKYKDEPGALLPILKEVQDTHGYIPRQAMLRISEELKVPLSKVYSAVTFYNQFKEKKSGKHTIRVCLGTACCVRRSEEILKALESTLGIKEGETDEKGLFTLERVNCVGACSLGPIVEIDGKIYSK
ncbi:MAG: NAD(P)H-dependent oxidoreductase subunit E, partial [Candidatus Micrarchaeia archaeon]